MSNRSDSPSKVVICSAAADELAELQPRLESEGFDVIVHRASENDAADVLRAMPSVMVVGSGESLGDRLELVRRIRRDVRAASVRLLWLLRAGGEADAETAVKAGADDVAVWSGGSIDGIIARVSEQAIASRVRRAAEREAALRAELARVDEALNRSEAEQAALQNRLTQPVPPSEAWARATTQPVQPLKTSPGHSAVELFGPIRGSRTVELTALEEPVVNLFNRRLGANLGQRPVDLPLSVLVAGIDAYKDLVHRGGDELGKRLLDAVADLAESLIDDDDATVPIAGGRLCILLPKSDEATAVRLARDLCAQVASAPVKVAPRPLQPTVSVGVATLERDEGASPFDLVEWASKALRTARERGGNRWWVFHRNSD